MSTNPSLVIVILRLKLKILFFCHRVLLLLESLLLGIAHELDFNKQLKRKFLFTRIAQVS